MNNNTIVTEIAPEVRAVFNQIDNLPHGYSLTLTPGDPFYQEIESTITRLTIEMKNADDIRIGDEEWMAGVFDPSGKPVRLRDLPEGWWDEATRGVQVHHHLQAITRLNGDYLLVSQGNWVLTGESTVDGEHRFEFTNLRHYLEVRQENENRYLTEHPHIVAQRPPWADTSNVTEIHADEVSIEHSRTVGVVKILCSPTYVNGALAYPEEPSLYIEHKIEEGAANPAVMRQVGSDLQAAAAALDPTYPALTSPSVLSLDEALRIATHFSELMAAKGVDVTMAETLSALWAVMNGLALEEASL